MKGKRGKGAEGNLIDKSEHFGGGGFDAKKRTPKPKFDR